MPKKSIIMNDTNRNNNKPNYIFNEPYGGPALSTLQFPFRVLAVRLYVCCSVEDSCVQM